MIKLIILPIVAFMCLPLAGIAQTLNVHVDGYDIKCNGSHTGKIIANAAGGTAPYSYIWTPAVGDGAILENLAAGTYVLTVRDADRNTTTETVTIHEPTAMTVNIDSDIVRPCFLAAGGGACGCSNTLWAVVSGGTPPYSYVWTPGDYTGDTLRHACYLEWAVQVTDANTCMETGTLDVLAPGGISITTGITGPNAQNNVSVYPNPVSNQLNISIGQQVAAKFLEVYDMKGERVLMQNLSGNESLITVDVARLAEGDYLLHLGSDDAQKTVRFSIVR